MLTREHEAPIELLSRSPELMVTMLMEAGHCADPDAKVFDLSERVTQMNPAELLADKVVRVELTNGESLIVIFEVQRGWDDDKKWTWPNYITAARLRHRKPVALLIWCPKRSVAKWAKKLISHGPAGTTTPWVISPEDFPVILDPAGWEGREDLAVVAALAHEGHARYAEIVDTLAALLDGIEKKQAAAYYRNLRNVVSEVAFKILERKMATMTYGFKSEIEQQFEAKGVEKGERRALLILLRARNLEPTVEIEEQIYGCGDPAQLEGWLQKAATAKTLNDIFG